MLATQPLDRYTLQQALNPKAIKPNGRYTYLGKDTQTQERVVIKVIQLEQAVHISDQWVDIKLFERETKLLETLDHPAIPKYKDAFETEIEGVRSFVLVQTYLEAESLETWIQSGKRFKVEEILEIAEQLLSILSYLHTQTPPVIHRDIKPSNILIAPPTQEGAQLANHHTRIGNIYLIDFGSVHTDLTKESGTITIVGSYGYIPLEQFAGQATPASDLYSLGMTLIYLITGVHPADIPHVDGKIQLTHPSLSSDLTRSSKLVPWLERMTQPYLHQRFESAQKALTALQAKATQQGSYQHLKPDETEIVLESTGDRIRITHAKPITTTPTHTYLITGVVFISILFTGQIAFLTLIFAALFFQATLAKIIVSMLGSLLGKLNQRIPSIARRAVIEIDRYQGIRTGTCGQNTQKVRWGKLTSRFQDLDLLVYNPGYRFASYKEGNNTVSHSDGGVPPELSVHSGGVTYTIGHPGLSPAEFWWLGQELSHFLGLELQTIYPMPIVTVASTSSCGC